MTYEELKEAYPLGCEVELNDAHAWRYRPEHITGGGPERVKYPHGRILATLDPEKHGPKCILFKIEKPKDAKISRESAEATLKRKTQKGFKRPPHPDHKGKLGIRRTETEEIDLDALAMPADKKGVLKWIRPSDIKERVGEKGPPWKGIGKDAPKDPGTLKPKDTMNRTEELKKILKPGMKVKLKETTEDWDRDAVPQIGRAREDLGKWIEVGAVSENIFYGSERFVYPLTMIEKVEGEEGDAEDNYVPPEPKGRYSLEDPDTIPVPREKVKEELREAIKCDEDTCLRESAFMRALFGHDIIDTLLQEIEEEEKYAKDLYINEWNNICSPDDDNPIAHVYSSKACIAVAKGRYTPEIHEQDGNYVVKFKREE